MCGADHRCYRYSDYCLILFFGFFSKQVLIVPIYFDLKYSIEIVPDQVLKKKEKKKEHFW